jgi:small subunit ribosomal protein S20
LANHPSALKRAKQNKVRNLKNTSIKSRIRTKCKQALQTVEASPESAQTALGQVTSQIDKAAAKGVLHSRTASRKISRLSKRIHKLSGKTAATA